MSKKQKRIVIFIMLVMLLIIMIFFANKRHSNNDKDLNNFKENTINNNEDISNIEIVTGTIIPDEEVLEGIDAMKISQEDKIYSVLLLGSFENGKKLTTEQYLKVVYNVLNNRYVSINRNIEDNKYTEKEVKDIVYTIFGIKLQENKSIEGLKYENGMYTFEQSKNNITSVAKNVEEDTAAGTIYVEFELYMEDVSGNQEFKGNYTVALGQNTENGERYIKSVTNN